MSAGGRSLCCQLVNERHAIGLLQTLELGTDDSAFAGDGGSPSPRGVRQKGTQMHEVSAQVVHS